DLRGRLQRVADDGDVAGGVGAEAWRERGDGGRGRPVFPPLHREAGAGRTAPEPAGSPAASGARGPGHNRLPGGRGRGRGGGPRGAAPAGGWSVAAARTTKRC